MLTQKQEKFTRLLFLGHTQREAWKLAGYSTNYPPEDIDANACKLASVTKIKQRLNELRDKAAEPDVFTVTQRRIAATEVIQEPIKQPVTAKERVMAIAELNKMDGIYETAPIQDNRQINVYVVDREAKELLGRIGERLDVQRQIEAEGE